MILSNPFGDFIDSIRRKSKLLGTQYFERTTKKPIPNRIRTKLFFKSVISYFGLAALPRLNNVTDSGFPIKDT